MYVTTENLVEAQRATPHTLEALLRDVTPERARAVHGGRDNSRYSVAALRTGRDNLPRAQLQDAARPLYHPGY